MIRYYLENILNSLKALKSLYKIKNSVNEITFFTANPLDSDKRMKFGVIEHSQLDQFSLLDESDKNETNDNKTALINQFTIIENYEGTVNTGVEQSNLLNEFQIIDNNKHDSHPHNENCPEEILVAIKQLKQLLAISNDGTLNHASDKILPVLEGINKCIKQINQSKLPDNMKGLFRTNLQLLNMAFPNKPSSTLTVNYRKTH